MTLGKIWRKDSIVVEVPDEAWELFKKIYESGMGVNLACRSLRLLNKEYDFSETRIKRECNFRNYKLRAPTRRIEHVGSFRR
jgi:hypothetical protein